jgi:hypothetical protein
VNFPSGVTQVMYDTTGGGKTFRRWNSTNLAWWHTFKHAALCLWKMFAKTLIAPWWHNLYPGARFFLHPSSFPSVQTHLIYLNLAYPSFRDRLQEMLEEDIAPRFKVVIKNMIFLFEFAIPTVHTSPAMLIAFGSMNTHYIHVCRPTHTSNHRC